MTVSNRNGRSDNNNAACHRCDEAIDSNVQVLQSDRDSKASHNGVPVTVGGYNDVRTSKIRVQGASPPAYPRVLQGRAKGRTSSTPSTKFVYNRDRRSNTASSRSTGSLSEKSNSTTTLGGAKIAAKSNQKFDSREGSTSPSTPGYSSSSQFEILMIDSGYNSDKVESSTIAAKSPVTTKFDQTNGTTAPKSGVIAKFETCQPRKEFAPGRQRPTTSHQRPTTSRERPIMSRERFITTPTFAPKFKRSDNYVSRSTALYKPSMASSTDTQQLASVRMTDKKCACGYSQHCNCSTKPFTSCVGKDASCKVSFPRSNSRRISNAQFQTGVRELDFPSGKIEDSFVKAQNSTRRILRQNRIEINQSASRVSSQSATPLIGQSEPCVGAITVQ